MPTWVFVLIIFGIGLGLAYYVDRMKGKPGPVSRFDIRAGSGAAFGARRERRERFRWMYFWYSGRFPSKEEQAEAEEKAREDDEERRAG